MKKLAMTFILSGLLFTGTAFAAEKQNPCQTDCSCDSSQVQKSEKGGSIFKPLFPEYEIQPRLEG